MLQTYDLSILKPGQQAIVQSIHSDCSMRRRLQDIGLIPGTKITCLIKSVLGDPIAYDIRGAVIALRKKDCYFVNISNITTR